VRRVAVFKTMPVLRFPVAVVMDCVPIASRWASERWQPSAVIPVGEADAPAEPRSPQRLPEASTAARWRFDGFWIELHRSEGEGYWLNLTSPAPKAFVMWRPAEDADEPAMRPYGVTVSYNEAARVLDAGEQVEGVPLAPELLAWMKPFVDQNYTPAPRKKIRRNDPFANDREGRR
jgi:hypothetical protein